MKDFVIGRIKSVKYAAKGMWLLVSTEHSVITQSLLALSLTFAGFYVGLSRMEWIVQLLVFGLVLSIEGLNTAVEKLCDFVHPDFHTRIGFIKDIAAGAVTFTALFGGLVLLVLYYPYYSSFFQ